MGELTYTAPVIGGGNGTGTASDPAVVHYGETLGVEVSQKTSYTDPNGEVFSCEPKAVIKLSVAKDTLYAKDLQALIDHNESKSNPSTSTANEKKTVQQLQMKLYSLGLLSTDGLEPGVLDEQTLQAVAEFQMRMNEQFNAGLEVVDPEDLTSVVDAITVRAIFASAAM